MKKVTVNMVVEISEGGSSNTYKTSFGQNFSGGLTEKDLYSMMDSGSKQIISQAITDTLIAFTPSNTVAQDHIEQGD